VYAVETARASIEVVRGDTWYTDILVCDLEDVPIDITGWTAWLTIKYKAEDIDANAVYQQKVTAHTDPTLGQTRFTLPGASSILLLGNFSFDIKVKTLASPAEYYTLCLGTFTVVPNITRSLT
jgi:hypothetical protein